MNLDSGKVALLLPLLLSVGCGETKQQAAPDASASAAATDIDPALDSRLANALKSVGKPSGSAPPASADQPPASGVFEPGLADKALAKGAPPKIQIFGDGNDPKIVLHAAAPEVEKLTVTVIQASQGNPDIPLVYSLLIGPPDKVSAQADKPKDDKAAKPKPAGSAAASVAPAASDAPSGSPSSMVALVQGITVAGVDKDELPKKLLEQVAALKGARVSFTVTPTGLTGFSHPQLADGEGAGAYDNHLSALEESLSALYTPAPDRPVGEGAYWMVTDRRTSFGSDVIRYRVFTVKAVEGDNAAIAIDVRQYAADESRPSIVAVENQQTVVVARYAAGGKGGIVLAPKSRWAQAGKVQLQVGADLVPSESKSDPQAPRGQVKFELAAQVGELDPSQLGGQPGGAPQRPGPARPPGR
jgi:hypothetical protein